MITLIPCPPFFDTICCVSCVCAYKRSDGVPPRCRRM